MGVQYKSAPFSGGEGAAVFSDDGEYRYYLDREWKDTGRTIVFILLNPSIGDERLLENTTAGCLSRAQKWGYSGMIVLNLFALISTNPANLRCVSDPVGPYNDRIIQATIEEADDNDLFVAAWGNHGKLYDRDLKVTKLLASRDIYCLGRNKDGSPRHPLHMSHSVMPELWRAKQ